jgi:hypothetical protein
VAAISVQLQAGNKYRSHLNGILRAGPSIKIYSVGIFLQRVPKDNGEAADLEETREMKVGDPLGRKEEVGGGSGEGYLAVRFLYHLDGPHAQSRWTSKM